MAFVVYLKYYEFDGWNAVTYFKTREKAVNFAKKEKKRNEKIKFRIKKVKNLNRVNFKI